MTLFQLSLSMSLSTYEMPLQVRKCEFHFLFVPTISHWSCHLVSEKVKGGVNELKIVKILRQSNIDFESIVTMICWKSSVKKFLDISMHCSTLSSQGCLVHHWWIILFEPRISKYALFWLCNRYAIRNTIDMSFFYEFTSHLQYITVTYAVGYWFFSLFKCNRCS